MEKFDVSVILPIKSSSSPWFEEYFKKCIESIKTQKTQINELIIVHSEETSLIEFLNSFDFGLYLFTSVRNVEKDRIKSDLLSVESIARDIFP